MSINKLADVIRRGAEAAPEYASQAFHAAKAVDDRFVVIDRNDLPKVGRTEHGNWWLVEGNPTMLNTDGFPSVRAQALAALAAAEYMDANPPVDEKAVADLVKRLRIEGVVAPRGVALALLADGWKREATS